MKFQGPEGLSGVLCKFGSILHPSQELQPNGAHSYILCVCVLACERERERWGRERELGGEGVCICTLGQARPSTTFADENKAILR